MIWFVESHEFDYFVFEILSKLKGLIGIDLILKFKYKSISFLINQNTI